MYQEYLQSEHWKLLKKRFYESKRFKDCCFVCEKKCVSYHIHHKTYKWIRKEKLQNLVALCPQCHKEVHFLNNQKLPLLSDVLNQRVYALKTQKKLGQNPASPRIVLDR